MQCEFTESRKSANRLRRCNITHRHARRLRAATGTVAPPFIDGRKSVASRAHTNMHATTDGAEILRSGNQPARSRHRSRPLPQTVRRLAQAPPTPFIDGRKSVASRAHANMRATTDGAEFLRSGNLPAPLRHRSRLLSQTVRRLAQAPPTPFRDGRKIGRVGPHQHAWNDRGGRNLEVRQPARAIAPSLSQTVRRLAQAPPTPFIDGRKSVASHAHTNMRATTEGAEILRSGNLPAPLCHRSPALSQTVRGSPHTPAAASRWSKIGPIDRPRQHACKHRV